LFVEPELGAGVNKSGSEHEENDTEGAWRVESQRHGGDRVRAGLPGEPQGHEEEQQVANQHADRRSGDHVPQREPCRKFIHGM
jgi:hypothetical protein